MGDLRSDGYVNSYPPPAHRVEPTEPRLVEIKSDPAEENDTNVGVSRGFADTMDNLFGGRLTGRESVENLNGTVIVPLDDQDVDLSRGYVRVAATWYRLTDESALTDETVGLLLDEGIFTTYE